MAIALLGALGQIVVHDIIPTFFAEFSTMDAAGMPLEGMQDSGSADPEISGSERGDLFSDDPPAAEEKAHSMPFYKTEQFVWTLKWTHIHLFGMNMIFIFMGLIATFLDVHGTHRDISGCGHPLENPAGNTALCRCPHRYRYHVAEGICIAGLFLASYTGGRSFWI
jgi:hypothetical protein